jgi:alkanesulfonate monooxygenase SsuD/methylene tetrahydromethanopterin reductase-like flavin-dependent oxidoreductase (luciferase family)
MAGISFHLFLPQMRMSLPTIVERARAAEAAGFEGIAFMDHLVPPMAGDQPMYEAMTTAAWVAAHTATLRVGHLVLCDALRHAPVLAKQAVTLDHASGGRFDLGIGWGSVPEELVEFDITAAGPAARAARLRETLATLRELWSGRQQPTPLTRIPIVIGGTGPKTVAMVADYADWWNVPLHLVDQLDARRGDAGEARVSVQLMVGYLRDERDRDEVSAKVAQRWGRMREGGGVVIGTAGELIDQFGAWRERGVERIYTWFSDFAAPETLAAFGADVIRAS